MEAMVRCGSVELVRGESNVFEVSRGLPRLAWHLVRWLYRRGSSEGLISRVYRAVRLRTDYNQSGSMLSLIGRDIRRKYLTGSDPLIVAHPILAGILKGRPGLIYQHGEVVTPREAVVEGAETVFVPTEEAARAFRNAGYGYDQIIVTGLCVEPSQVRQAADAYQMRMKRLDSTDSLTGAFFSSGAEPVGHIEKLVSGAIAVVSSGGKAVIFARRGGRLVQAARLRFGKNRIDLSVVDVTNWIPRDLPPATLVMHSSRREEDSVTARFFCQFDYFVAPPHERTNWALGLGLPMIALTPTIGPFAPLNLRVLHDHAVAKVLDSMDDARSLGQTLQQQRQEGRLRAMAEAGWGRYSIDGFARIAEFLADKYRE